ncbi:MAG: response regulator transcription factor [Rhodospirillales bacterium]|nr:response regulator transcription factor [Rhodospirillales bacterium]MDE2326287.1 response regulator transcription factor [Rhodospirillales bacterium]
MQQNNTEKGSVATPFVPFLARSLERPRLPYSSSPVRAAAVEAAVPGRTRIGLVDSSRLTRECLASALVAQGADFAVRSFVTAEDCIDAAGEGFDLLLCHAHEDGPAAKAVLADIAALREAFPGLPIVVLHDAAETPDTGFVRLLFQEGAQGFVPTRMVGIPLAVAAIRFVQAGGRFAPVDLLLDDRPPPPSGFAPGDDFLTPRQKLVFAHLRQGKANKIIAYELGVSERTVKVHIKNIMRKIGATNRTQAVYKAQSALLRAFAPDAG